jgi:hypothetical protein
MKEEEQYVAKHEQTKEDPAALSLQNCYTIERFVCYTEFWLHIRQIILTTLNHV